jgi:ABC-type multidrug transport system fused ATPase/permease subunit
MIKKIFFLLSFAEKITIFLLATFSCLISLLEVTSIFALFLFINFLSNSEKTNYNFILNKFIEYFNLDLSYDFFFYFVLFLFFIKFFLSNLLSYAQFKFVNNLRAKISQKLIQNYLTKKLIFFIKNDNSSIVKYITADVSNFTNGVVQQILIINLEILTIIGISFFIISLNLKIFILSLITFVSLIFLWINLSKKIFSSIGKLKFVLENEQYKLILDIIRGIKEIKIYKAENFFLEKTFLVNSNLAKRSTGLSFLQQLPRGLIEIIILLILSIIFIFNFDKNISKNDTLVFLSTFAIIGFRLIPSDSKIST